VCEREREKRDKNVYFLGVGTNKYENKWPMRLCMYVCVCVCLCKMWEGCRVPPIKNDDTYCVGFVYVDPLR
jgi:hypothetical protein